MREAFHEFMVYAAGHPFALAFAEATRRLGDVVSIPMVGKVVNRPEIARAILLDDVRFSKSGPGSFGVVITQVMGESALLNMDGKTHLRLRSKLQDLFSPAYLRVIDAQVLQPPAERLYCDLLEGRTIDMVRFAQLLTGRTISLMLGLEEQSEAARDEHYLEMFRSSREMTDSIRLTTTKLTDAQVAAKKLPFQRLTAAVVEAYGRDAVPDDSVIARLKALGLTADESRGVVATMLMAGTETLTTAIPRMVALLADSGQLSLLRDDPSLAQGAIDEVLRFVVPSPIMLRSVRADVDIGGHRFHAGERVVIFTYNLFKHRSLYPRPCRFDIRRLQPAIARNLWFGAGHHFCLGFALAQREMRSVLDTIIRLPRPLRVRGRRYARGILIPGYSRLDVEMIA
jgi:cytochrome P450